MAEDTKQAAAPAVQTVTLTIDGRETTVPKGTTVLEAAKDMGIHIPTFCWHPKLKSVGACRMCYVEIEKMPKLQVSCATEAMDGMVVHTDSDQVLQGRKAVIEFILLNHPLDCPTCDKGGECDLQNLTFRHGVDDTRFDFQKYRFRDEDMASTFDDLKIGPEIVLNRNRCILCYKCVRANKEAFGEYDLGNYERGNISEINAAPGEEVDNPYSGNLVEICPVGALTNSDWRYKIRVWLTKTSPSICNMTSSGINTTFFKEDHKNHIYRVTSRVNDDIDDGWLPDVTRYGYQVITSPDRLKKPLVKKEGKQVEVSWEEALETIHKRFAEIKENKGNVCLGGLIAPNLDNATMYSFSKFFRTVLNSNNVDFRTHYRMLPKAADSIFGKLCARPFKIADIDDSDLIVTFASDLLREHPNEYLRIRKAYNFNAARIFSINPYAVKTADVAEAELVYNVGYDETVINGICLAAIEENLVDSSRVGDLKSKITPGSLAEAARITGVEQSDYVAVARALASGKKITFIIGEFATRSIARDTIGAALANLNRLFGIDKNGQLAVLSRAANSMAGPRLGAVPEPDRAVRIELETLWGSCPDAEPHNTDAMLVQMKKEEINGMFLMGVNPMRLYPDREFAAEGLEKVEFLVACDMFETETTTLADVVLPLASWAEYEGSYTNLEGRVQKAPQALKPIGESKPGFEIMTALAEQFEKPLYDSIGQMDHEVDRLMEREWTSVLPDEYLEAKQVKLESDDEYPHPILIGDDPHHYGHLTEKSNSLSNFAAEAYIELSRKTAEAYGIKEGDPVRVESKVGKVVVPARISRFNKNDVILIPRNFSSTTVTSLLMRKRRVDRVKLSKVDA